MPGQGKSAGTTWNSILSCRSIGQLGAHTLRGQRMPFFAAVLGILLIKNWLLAWLGFEPCDMAKGWGWLLTGTILRSLRSMDAISDLGIAAIICYRWTDRSCAWDGEAQCEVYLQLLIVVSVAAGTDVLVSGAFTFLDAAKAGQVHAALHVVSLVCEVGILTGTILLQQHGSQAELGPGVSRGKAGRADLFLAPSGSFNLITFALNTVGLSAIIKGVGLCVRRIQTARSITFPRPPLPDAGLALATGPALKIRLS